MVMSDLYGSADRAESIATIHAALDAGITLLDTRRFLTVWGDNELLIAEAFNGVPRNRVVVDDSNGKVLWCPLLGTYRC